MFSPSEFLDFCKESGIKPKKWKKIFRAYLKSKDFYGWLFNPSKEQIVDFNGITETMYSKLSEDPDKINMMTSLIAEDPEEFGRSTAVFLYSISRYGVDVANHAFRDVDERFAAGEFTRSEATKKNDKIQSYAKCITNLTDAVLEIIRKDAKKLSKASGVPKHICKTALCLVPDPIFITNAKVGVYLNLFLESIYSDIDRRETDIEDIDWNEFFDTLFSKSSRYEVASFILLESPNHIAKFNSKNVRYVWDSLTAWSLSTLEKVDDGTRSHMIDLYLKRLGKAIDSNEPSVRIDLREISEREYPRLTKTISGYSERFDELFKPLELKKKK